MTNDVNDKDYMLFYIFFNFYCITILKHTVFTQIVIKINKNSKTKKLRFIFMSVIHDKVKNY